MATTGVGFRWLDILEKEFDKACVELDTSLSELETEEPEVVFTARQKISTLSSCFAQLTHKALTIFQNSAKLEAELVDMRAELVQARVNNAGACEDGEDSIVSVNEAGRARAEAAQLARENAALRETVLALHSELFGARLATKYLDKELAGRIQQLQLLGRDMRPELRDSLWAQVEAEILLQRHKTLVRVCRGPRARPAPAARARSRTVRVRRSPHLGLGISVTGGREHGVPILISELEAGGPAALTRELYVGDAILAINDVDLTQACHKEAVQALQSVKGDCALCVQFIATDDEDRLSEDNYRFPLFPEAALRGDATPTAPRTPDYTRNESEDGSGSECESPYRPAPYPDYNSINNNLAILDMDDDSIKIEARLEMVENVPGACGADATHSPRAAATPVHARARQGRRRQDWRSKGAYRRVDCDEHTLTDTTLSDTLPESPLSPDLELNPGPATPPGATIPSGPIIPPGPTKSSDFTIPQGPTIPSGPTIPGLTIQQGHTIPSGPTIPSVTIPSGQTIPGLTIQQGHTIPSGPTKPSLTIPSGPTIPGLTIQQGHAIPSGPTIPAGPTIPLDPTVPTARSAPGPFLPATPLVEVPTAPLLPDLPTPTFPTRDRNEKPKTNGEVKAVRRESKGFRIGSARRVVGSAATLSNGQHSLLAGDGDPDFGTPV
ncbi:protein Shroom2 isoform X2 [Amyelois transitella]|uniref:protein Shroom2 isoform X2 n=1 Tax=Amyelois transitella TaxID=680683 RepID=UPI00298F7B27|nr:protein Shroom2 isoform X2 [Amyelois transitella]